MNLVKKMATMTAGLVLSGFSMAGHRAEVYYDYARVVRVNAIVETYNRPVSREVCHDEPVEYYQPRYTYHRDRTGPTIAGAVIGGALGNLVGKGDGRKAATIAGALIGGTIAHKNSRGGTYSEGGYYKRGYEEYCHQETDYRTQERITGYEVTYRYNGRTFHDRLSYDPGNRVRVRVAGYDDEDVVIAD